jgi:transcriptional regulator with XRE-family HTH domain
MNTQVNKVGIQHDRVRALRISKGYSIKGLAEKLDVKYQNIQNIERPNGVKKPSYMADLADVLDVSIDYLLGLEDELTPNTFTFDRLDFEFDSKHKNKINSGDVYDAEVQKQKTLTVDYNWIKSVLIAEPSSSMKIVSPQDDTMKPFFGKNDILLVDTADIEPDNGIYVYKDSDKIRISRLQIKQGKVYGLYVNKAYDMLELSGDCQIYGRVTYLWREDPLV